MITRPYKEIYRLGSQPAIVDIKVSSGCFCRKGLRKPRSTGSRGLIFSKDGKKHRKRRRRTAMIIRHASKISPYSVPAATDIFYRISTG